MIPIPIEVKEFIAAVRKAGYECYAVGGSVRDTLLGRPTKTWDFATNATPEEIQKIFPDSFYNNKFGTVGVKTNNDVFEITTYRKEGKYTDARHPDKVVWAKTIEEDLARRELTISAIATDGEKIVDPYEGQKDLENKIVRTVGKPDDRFSEDSLRMIRAVRIATQLGFIIDEKTFEAIKKHAAELIGVSGERIRDELVKILSADFPADGVRLLDNTGLLEIILPELVAGKGVSQKGTHHLDDVFTHCIKCLENCQNKNWLVRFATLVHDIGKPVTYVERNGKATFYNHETVGAHIAKTIADRLHFSREDREKLYMLVRWHMFSVSEFLTDAAVRRFIKRVGPENTTDMLDLRTSDRLGSGVPATSWRHKEFRERIVKVQAHIPSVNDLKVDGNDVMKTLGIGPGPKVGAVLAKLFEEISEDPKKNDRDHLLKQIQKLQ